MSLLIIILILISVVLQFIFKKKLNNSQTQENTRFYFEYYGFVATIIAILIAVYSIQQSQLAFEKSEKDSVADSIRSSKSDSLSDVAIKLANQTTAQLVLLNQTQQNLSEKLKELPKEVDNFSKSIKNLNSVMATQQNNLAQNIGTFSKSLGSLNNNIDIFSKSLVNYNEQLSNITETTDKQLKIVQEQQRLFVKEMSKDAEVFLYPTKCELKDSCIFIKTIEMWNNGDVDVEISHINIRIFNKDLVEFKLDNSILLDEDKISKTYSLTLMPPSFNNKILMGGKSKIDLEIKLLNKAKDIQIQYVVAFQTKNNKSHMPKRIFYINERSCTPK
jgi:uncharacterized protein YeaC (DUF1315 family)